MKRLSGILMNRKKNKYIFHQKEEMCFFLVQLMDGDLGVFLFFFFVWKRVWFNILDRIEQFCKLYEAKLGIKSQILRKTLWGEYYFNPKTKKIYNKNTSGKMVPMFAQFVLNNIWEVYNAVYQ